MRCETLLWNAFLQSLLVDHALCASGTLPLWSLITFRGSNILIQAV